MIQLISFMPNDDTIKEFETHKDKIEKLKIDGIETVYGDYCSDEIFRTLPVKGIHLIYFPTWLDIWYEKKENLLSDFGTIEPLGIKTKEQLIEIFRKQFQDAKTFNPEYMVFHVSHVRPRDIFSFSYEYSNREVMQASIELINEVFQGEGPLLLFENLPWPGINFHSQEETAWFLDSINYKNCGLILDLSHLMCLNRELSNYDEGAEYIQSTITGLGNLKEKIFGVHLNGSLSREYLSNDFLDQIPLWESKTSIDRYMMEIHHVKSIDTHSVFESHKLDDIFKSLPLKYIVHELEAKTLGELLEKVEFQQQFFNISQCPNNV